MKKNNLQNDIEKFKDAYKQVSLSVDERQNIKSQLFAKISPEKIKTPTRSPFFAVSFYLKMAPVALIIFTLIGAPVSFAAERSLPGQPLYKFKTKVNEEVKAVFVPEEEKNDYYQSLLTKRAGEIRKLSKKGEIEERVLVEFEDVLENNVKDSIKAIKESKDPKEDILQDYQTVVAVLSLNEESLNIKDGNAMVRTAHVFSAVETVTEEIESGDKTREKLHSLKKMAMDALTEKVEEASKNSDEDSEKLVKELIDDAREKVQKVIQDGGESAKETELVKDESDSKEHESLLIEVENIANPLLMHSTANGTTTTKLNQVLDLHERLTKKALEYEVEKMVPDLDL